MALGPALLAAAGGLAACGGGAEGPERRPNVLLISLDTLRADHLRCYGYGRATSPRIDALAAEGVLFEDAISPTSWTLPAHLSMLTGLAISAHGVCDDRLWQARPDGAEATIPLRGRFLPELLSEVGYQTAGFYTWKYLEPRFGFGPGFDVYERIGHSIFSHPEWSRRFSALREAGKTEEIQAWMAESPELFDEQRPTAGEAVDRALEWLDGRDAERPFFLFVHLFDIHDGYVPPAPFDAAFTDPDYAGPITGRRVTTPDSPVQPNMAAEDLAQLIALYDGEIAWVDSQVGRLLDRLEEQGLTEDTLVVLTSDHGEEFFEHGAKTHRAQLHRESVHVPLILSWPGQLPAGGRHAGTVGLVDLVPTVCALAAAPGPERSSGRDLSAVARGREALASAEYTTQLVVFPPGAATPDRHVGLWDAHSHTYLRRPAGGPAVLHAFDLAADPSGAGAGTPLARNSEAARAVLARLEAVRLELRDIRAASPLRHADGSPLSPEEIAELGAMGYAGFDGSPEVGGSERLCLDGCVWPD